MNPTYQFLKNYKNYEIFVRAAGFEVLPIAFGKVISFLVRGNKVAYVFAFAYSGLEAIQNESINEKDLYDKAIGVIEKYIDSNKIEAKQEYTFEYKNEAYEEKDKVEWWVKSII